ncbi:hypothetical protein A4249_05825 [Brevundimonas sp. GW460-12-10-14-LB2]|nr:hypothetical protein A4249_05825 [Brevundimonas sp. GW460-12-10-14-LB2]
MKLTSGTSVQLLGGWLVGASMLLALTFILWGVSIGHSMEAVRVSALALAPMAVGLAMYRFDIRKTLSAI